MGTIGLAAGGKVNLTGGAIQPGNGFGLGGEDGGYPLAINGGDLIFGDNSKYTCNFLTQSFDVIVNGLLDLRGAGDAINLPFPFLPPNAGIRQYVVIEYQNRLGAFDIINKPAYATVAYTSAENSGPGQVIVTVPEPGGALASVSGVVALIAGCAARSRRCRGAPGRVILKPMS
jgi:hypothetical protein